MSTLALPWLAVLAWVWDNAAWLGAIALLVLSVSLSATAIGIRRPALALTGLVPIGLGMLALAFRIDVPAPHPVLLSLVALAFAALAIVGGNPVTLFVLGLTSAGDPRSGEHGGIVVPAEKGTRGSREVLRGGWVIGYLERLAIVAAIVLGHFEIIAAVIAIKGLGRFAELDNAEARERFIIGTLTSMIWATGCAVLIVFSRLV